MFSDHENPNEFAPSGAGSAPGVVTNAAAQGYTLTATALTTSSPILGRSACTVEWSRVCTERRRLCTGSGHECGRAPLPARRAWSALPAVPAPWSGHECRPLRSQHRPLHRGRRRLRDHECGVAGLHRGVVTSYRGQVTQSGRPLAVRSSTVRSAPSTASVECASSGPCTVKWSRVPSAPLPAYPDCR